MVKVIALDRLCRTEMSAVRPRSASRDHRTLRSDRFVMRSGYPCFARLRGMTIQRTVAVLAAALSIMATMALAPVADLVAAQKERIRGYAAKPLERPHLSFVSNGVADFWTIAKAGSLAAGKELGCEVTVVFPGAGLSDQKRMLEDLVIRGIDGVSVSPIDPKNQTEVLDQIAEHALLITNDSDAPASPRLCYIGMDNYLAGRQCGELARKALPEGGEVAIFIGRLEQDNAKRRWQGFVDGLLGRSVDAERRDDHTKPFHEAGYTIVGTWTDSFDRAKAKANIEDVMTRHPNLALVTGLFEYNSVLAVEVFRQAGRAGKIKIAAFDEGAEVLVGIREGIVLGTVVQDPYGYGYESIKVLHALTQGKLDAIPEGGIMNIPARTITKDDVDAFWSDLKAKLAAGSSAR
ncbi:MAG: substrate-binding domain-containing protein [Phycisphaerae bacterium]|nr:substrate-binding domain-containing protein [Phycisphaerae bacterium]